MTSTTALSNGPEPPTQTELLLGGNSGTHVSVVDLTHRFSIHTPGWVGYPSPKLSYFQRHATNGIVSQLLELPLHSGTHFDAEMHIISGGSDIASIPLSRLIGTGVIVDISEAMDDWTVIKPRHIPDRIEVRKGAILIYHPGYGRFYNGCSEEDEERYFLRHPGGDRELAEWIVEMELAWTGFDCASGDNPLNTSIRTKWRPEIARHFEEKTGQDVAQLFPVDDLFVMHRVPFRQGICHVENLGGDLGAIGTRRCVIGAFPMPIIGGEASPCRVVALLVPDER
jgi:kynurenine formamidase